MRHLFSMTIAACMLAATDISGAADFPIRAPVAPAPPLAWTGCYVGLNAGVAWGRVRDTWNANPSVFPPPEIRDVLNGFGSGTIDASGFVGGGQVGCQRQINAAVFGIEADIQYTGLSGSRPVSFPGNSGVLPLNFREDFRSTWLATFRGRAGWLVNPAVLLYATGGVAVANLKTFDFVVDATNSTSFDTASGSGRRVGWTAGVGAEWMFAPQWSVKTEYLYVDLGRFNTLASSHFQGTVTPASISHSHRLTEHIVRAGLNYKF